MTGEHVEIHNRPATVEKLLPTTSIVRWQDNGTQGFVPTERVNSALDDSPDTDDHAELRDGEPRDDSHAARNAAALASLEREIDDSDDETGERWRAMLAAASCAWRRRAATSNCTAVRTAGRPTEDKTMSDTNDANGDAPATEQFDLTMGQEFHVDPEDIDLLASEFEQADAFDAESATDEELAEYASALKRLESSAEDARKDVFEDELDDRTDVDDEVGDLVKRQGHNKYLFDEDAAIEAIEAAGGDPRQVMSVKSSDFVDTAEALGVDPDEHVGRAEYEYFRRQS